MTPLSPISKKRLAKKMAEGKVQRGTFIIDVKDARERQDAIGRGIREVLFGKPKKQESAEKRARRLAIAEADKWFSEWIRLRDSDANGWATCITSGRRLPWRQVDCGHYVSRAKWSVRYEERNAHAQSKMANRYQGGHFVEHGNAIDRIHGAGTAEALRLKGLQRCSMTTDDFLFKAKVYKERVEWIKQHEPDKYHSPKN